MKIYSIANWDDNYEVSQSRKCKKLSWVAFKNSHDGNGYGRVAAHPKATDLFAAFILIVEVASKCKDRGVLSDKNGVPLTAEDLAFKTRFPVDIFTLAFEELVRPEIGWLEVEEQI